MLYGSAAVGDQHEKFSDYNVLCVLSQITPAQLGATETVFRWWREQGNPSPLLLTEHEVRDIDRLFRHRIPGHQRAPSHPVWRRRGFLARRSTDVFIARRWSTICARNCCVCARKPAGILSDKDALCRLLADSVSTFCVLFRHALILHGVDAPARKRDIIERAQERFGIDPAPFNALLDQREERVKPKEIEPATLLAAYLNEIGKVIDAVDVLDKAAVMRE